MNVKAGAAQTGGAFTVIEWSAPIGFGPPLELTWANGTQIKVAGAAGVTWLWAQFQARGGITGLGGYPYR
jgi:hypothetical protein